MDCQARQAEIQALLEELTQRIREPQVVSNGEELDALERSIVALTDRLAGEVIGVQLQAALASEELAQEEAALTRRCGRTLRADGFKAVRIRPLRGEAVEVWTHYYRAGRPRVGRRSRGLYPGLMLLSIHERCSPGRVAEVSLLATVLSSLEEARGVLEAQGQGLAIKTLRSITYRHAERARQALEAMELSPGPSLSGRRVIMATDGGRLRLRQDSPILKSPKGRRRYRGEWREPKLIHVYSVDEHGQRESDFRPFIDGTLKGADALFALLAHYLEKLGITAADTVLVVADGAHWIWNRVGPMLLALGLKPGHWYEVVDFYPAVEHLGAVAAGRKGWSERERRAWIKRHRRLLKSGNTQAVIEAIQALCKGRLSKALRRERDYFIRNRHRLAYDRMKQLKLPLGSGAMESAIRRVVNLRLKGAGIFWHEASAEAMLLLRSYYKAGRWNWLKKLMLSTPCAVTA